MPNCCHPCRDVHFAIITGGIARPSLDHRLPSFDAFGMSEAAGAASGVLVRAWRERQFVLRLAQVGNIPPAASTEPFRQAQGPESPRGDAPQGMRDANCFRGRPLSSDPKAPLCDFGKPREECSPSRKKYRTNNSDVGWLIPIEFYGLGDTLKTVNAKRQTAEKAKPLSVAERKALVAEVAKTASPKAKRGLAMIDFRDPTPEERALGESLVELGRRALARNKRRKAAQAGGA